MNDQDIHEDRETTEEESQLVELRKLALDRSRRALGEDRIGDALDAFGLFERVCGKCYERGIK